MADDVGRVANARNPVAEGADALALCTPWPDYASIDFARLKHVMRGDLVLDGRNMLDPAAVEAAGVRYEGNGPGRPHSALIQI